jgi:hypothetical protein
MQILFLRHLKSAIVWGLAGVTACAFAETAVIEQPGRGTNRIEVTGNQADGKATARCDETRRGEERRAPGSAAGSTTTNVNSVNISGQSLQGKTIIVTDGGRGDCAAARPGAPGSSNTNSVNIR